jgi:hypothetical protein
MQVSTGSRTVWMMVALGSARWIKPVKRKFAGILSVIREAVGANRRIPAR